MASLGNYFGDLDGGRGQLATLLPLRVGIFRVWYMAVG